MQITFTIDLNPEAVAKVMKWHEMTLENITTDMKMEALSYFNSIASEAQNGIK